MEFIFGPKKQKKKSFSAFAWSKFRSQFVFEGNLFELTFKEEQLLTPKFWRPV